MSRIARISNAVTGALGDLLANRAVMVPQPSPFVGNSPREGLPGLPNAINAWLQSCRTPSGRVKELEFYDYLEQEIPDVPKALDAYATMATTGNLAGGGHASFTIRLADSGLTYPEALVARFRRLEIMMDRMAFSAVRAMVKYGSFMPEIVGGMLDDGRLGVTQVKPIPPGTIFRFIEDNPSPDRYWIQVINNQPVRKGHSPRPNQDPMTDRDAAIPLWKLPHFALWTNVVSATNTRLYGTSILQPFGGIGLKVHGSLDAMVVARLTRAAQRYVWSVDVSDIKDSQQAIQRRLKAWQQQMRPVTLFDGNNGDSYKRPPTPDEDIFVPTAEGLHYGVNAIGGDANVGRVGDIEELVKFYFGALGVPPEYLGHQRSQGGRSNLSQVDIHFARTVRHIQIYAASAFSHIVWTDMMLGGYDPRVYPIKIVPPPIGARDDLLQAQIRALQSQVIERLKLSGMRLDVNPGWVLRTFLGMDEELDDLGKGQIEALFEAILPQGGGEPPESGRKEAEEAIRRVHQEIGPFVRSNIAMLAAMQQDQGPVGEYARGVDLEEIRSGLSASGLIP